MYTALHLVIVENENDNKPQLDENRASHGSRLVGARDNFRAVPIARRSAQIHHNWSYWAPARQAKEPEAFTILRVGLMKSTLVSRPTI